ncbi:MAG: isoaspartyl peptidase/L-asparaginase family protein [Patescibacteria group bacterium]
MQQPTLVLHGGAIFGAHDHDETRDPEYHDVLNRAAVAGSEILYSNGSALDAVESAIRVLEDCGLFEAGRGSVFTYDGKNELDASIMDGKTLKAGSIAGVNHIKNPISAARKVYEHTWHVMLSRRGAERLAQEAGLEMVVLEYFFNETKWQQHLDARSRLDKEQNNSLTAQINQNSQLSTIEEPEQHSTVGAVALDAQGNLAAGTSTGGLELKRYGRIGDSPIIGAGTYADNEVCAISCTGQGEYFIRTVAAHDVYARMRYGGQSLEDASAAVLRSINALGGRGGMVGIDKDGNTLVTTTSNGIYAAVVRERGKVEIPGFIR